MTQFSKRNKQPDIRYLYDMREVLYDQKWAKSAPNLKLYYMYRGLKYEDGLRYDITVIPFRMLGKEFVKTKGHKHPHEYAELYEVLEGKAIFLMQKPDDVYAVEAKKGDKVFIPAHYGHITINPGPEELKMSNWTADEFKSDYSLFLEKQGACYLAIARNSKVKTRTSRGFAPPCNCFAIKQKSKIEWLKNKNYGKIPELRFEEPNKNIPKDLKKALMER